MTVSLHNNKVTELIKGPKHQECQVQALVDSDRKHNA